MNKGISMFLCFLLLSLMLIFPVHAADNQISIEEMREMLMGYGLPHGYVNALTDLEIENFYNRIQTGKSEITLIEKHATIDAIQSGVNTYGLINEENFTLSIGAATDYDDNNRINKVVGFVIWQWKDGHPGGRRDDLVHIYWEPSSFSFTSDNFISMDRYTKHLGELVEYNRATSPAKATTSDMVVYTDVYSGLGVDRGGWCVFTLIPAKPMYKGKDYSTPIAVTYYHNKSMVPFVNSFTYSDDDSGLQINFDDILTDTLASSYAYRYS